MEKPSPRPSTYAFPSGSSSGRIPNLAGDHAGGGRSPFSIAGDIAGHRSGDRQRFGWRPALRPRLHQPVCARRHGCFAHHPSYATARAKPAHGAPPADKTATRAGPAEGQESQLTLTPLRLARKRQETRAYTDQRPSRSEGGPIWSTAHLGGSLRLADHFTLSRIAGNGLPGDPFGDRYRHL